MTNGETAMQRLLHVQEVDIKIRDMESEAATIPAEFQKWDKLVSEKEAGLATIRNEVEECKKALRHLERQVEGKQEELAKYNAQLPLIKTNREYKAILLEIDGVEKEISDLEEHILERMTEIEEVEARVAAEEALVNQAREEADREKEKLDGKRKALKESLDGTRSQREQLAAAVDVALLGRYDRIRVQKGGLATARINNESCGACHMMLPPQVVNEVIGGVIKTCPSCSRLLYWMELERI
jgi:predicted  nucleic acid-binding Zn-ribbon protein